jgi:hypothetical protein
MRWFLTKESGLGPAWCGIEGCSGCANPPVVSRGIVAYAVLKTYPLPDVATAWRAGGVKRTVGQSFLKPLCGCSLNMLVEVALSVQRALGTGGDMTECLMVAKTAMCFNSVRVRTEGTLNKLAFVTCNVCCNNGYRWCAAGLYQSGGERMRGYAWFNGVTDAVGMVETRRGPDAVRWLSCPSCRYL